MAAGKMNCIRKRELVNKNGKFWKDGVDGVYQHPVNDRLLRGMKNSWDKKAYEVLGTWDEYQEWLKNGDNDATQKQPEAKQEPEKEEAQTQPEIPAKEEKVKETIRKISDMKMAELRIFAKGKLDDVELNSFRGVKGRTALIKRLEEI